MSDIDTYRFRERLRNEWLPAYCSATHRNYDPAGFLPDARPISDLDARDCALAIDHGVVVDIGSGLYRAARSSATEVLFSEGHKRKSPRRIRVWLEPVITFASLARLHFRHRWPKECLGTQPKGGAFDVVGYCKPGDDRPSLLGEIKKSSKELRALRDDLLALADGAPPEARSTNSVRKWDALLATRPALLWLVGPAEEQFVYAPAYLHGGARLAQVDPSALDYSAG